MCSAKTRAVALAARFTALTGQVAHVEELADRIRVIVALPAQLNDIRRCSLLVALAEADRYGHDVTSCGATVWAEVGGGDSAEAATPDL
ncbi:hypothetical protein [Streptomyces sp. NPDC006739]|uniref:hypothetical protein n=1 Tax=Streptomyces sp. NPDC006739 TaxID=3364763 RepID=UPI0036B99B03